MKRYIRSAITHIRTYKRVKASTVTRKYLKESGVLNSLNLSTEERNELINGILQWKNTYGVFYHHNDMNTYHNEPDNIILIDSSAHGYLHSAKTALMLQRKYGMAYIPGYSQGYLAEENEKAMYKKLSDSLEFDNYSANQIISILEQYEDELYENKDNLKQIVYRILESNNSRIFIVHGDLIRQELSDVETEKSADVYFVDDITGDAIITLYLDPRIKQLEQKESLTDEEGVELHSLKAIESFIDHNTVSISKILRSWKEDGNR